MFKYRIDIFHSFTSFNSIKMRTTYAIAALRHASQPHLKVLNLRVTKDRKPKHKSLGIVINAKNWDKKNHRVYSKEPNAAEINSKLEEVLLKAQTDKTILTGEKEDSFITQARKIIKNTHNTNTRLRRTGAVNKLEDYLKSEGKAHLSFKEINTLFIESYYNWLLNHADLKTSSANEYLQTLKQLIQKIESSGTHRYDINPFSNHTKKKSETKVEVVNDEDLSRLIQHTPKTKKQAQALNTFFLMMHLSGIRISDALMLTYSNFYKDNKGRLMLTYRIQKTGRLMTTKVSYEASLHISHFLPNSEELKRNIQILETKYDTLRSEMLKEEREMESINLKPFGHLMRYVEGEDKDTPLLQNIIREEAKREARKHYLSYEVKHKQEQLDQIKDEVLELIGNAILDLKKQLPNRTLLPYLKDIYNGEEQLKPEQQTTSNRIKTLINNHLRQVAKQCHIATPLTSHQARHIFAMRLFSNGTNMHHISLALGHSSISVTDAYRQKLIDDSLHDITDSFSTTLKDLI